MSQSVSLSLYALRVTERRKNEHLSVDAFDGSTDLLGFIYDSLLEFQGNSMGIKGGTRSVYITNDLNKNGRVIDGHVEVGNSGFTASIKDVSTGRENYRQKTTDAAMIPLHFRFWVPKGQPFGLTALQHYGDSGCKTAISDILTDSFNEKHPDHTLKIRQVVPKAHAREVIENGGIKELRFTQFGVQSDIADLYGGASLPPDAANVELRVVAKRENHLAWTEWMMKAIDGKGSRIKGALEIDSFKSDRFQMRINYNGKEKTLKVGELLQLNSRIDVSDLVEYGADGHPTRKTISDAAAALLSQITSDDLGVKP